MNPLTGADPTFLTSFWGLKLIVRTVKLQRAVTKQMKWSVLSIHQQDSKLRLKMTLFQKRVNLSDSDIAMHFPPATEKKNGMEHHEENITI